MKISVKKMIAITFSAAISAAFLATNATAAIKTKARANKTSAVYFFTQYDPNTCSYMQVPKFKVKYVERGQIAGRTIAQTLRSGRCKGTKVKGVVFIYKPPAGFRGTTKATIQLTMPAFTDGGGNAARTLDLRIDVK